MIETMFIAVAERDEDELLPPAIHRRIGVVLPSATLESNGELERAGKNVRRTKERWASLCYERAPTEVFQVGRFPGSRRSALLAVFDPPLVRFSRWTDLLRAPIGKWVDVQLLDGMSMVGFSIREERCAFRLRPGVVAPRWRECFGELREVSDAWRRYLIG